MGYGELTLNMSMQVLGADGMLRNFLLLLSRYANDAVRSVRSEHSHDQHGRSFRLLDTLFGQHLESGSVLKQTLGDAAPRVFFHPIRIAHNRFVFQPVHGQYIVGATARVRVEIVV